MRKILLALLCALILSSGAAYAVTDVGTETELQAVNAADMSGSYKMTADITCTVNSDSGFTPIGSVSAFGGTFDGDGHKIKNLFINRQGETEVGLFKTTSGGTIKNAGLENVSIAGGQHLGALLGYSDGCTISECFATGSVGGVTDIAAGLVGRSVNATTITNCYSRCSITAQGSQNGEFVGYIDAGTISKVYAAATISGTVGGLSVSTGITQSYWDSTIGAATSGSGTGKTTTEMKTESTFTDPIASGVVNVAYDGDMYMDWVVTRVSGTSFDGMWMENITIDGTSYAISMVLDGDHMISSCQSTLSGVAYSYGTGWDFTNIWNIDTTGVINDGYPYLRNVLPSSSGSGTSTKRKPIVVWWN